MKKIYKVLLILCFLIIGGVVVFQTISRKQYQNWMEQQTEIQMDIEKFEEILSDSGYKLEIKDVLEVEKISKPRYGSPVNAWYANLIVGDSTYITYISEYSTWEEAHHIANYQTQWLKDTFQDYKGHFFSHGTFMIEIYPGNIRLQRDLIKVLMEAEN